MTRRSSAAWVEKQRNVTASCPRIAYRSCLCLPATGRRDNHAYHCNAQHTLFTNMYVLCVIRPSGTVVHGGLMFYCWCFFSTRDLRGLSADRRETLPHDQKVLVFYHLGPKILGALPRKSCGQNMPNLGRFRTTSKFDREYIRTNKDSGAGANLKVGGTFPARNAGKIFFTVPPHFFKVPP